MCKFCRRWLIPPNGWVHAERESKEMLAMLLKKLKPTMTKVSLMLLIESKCLTSVLVSVH